MALTGGYFPVELKFAGYDALIIEGRAETPTYVWIKDGKVQFRDAPACGGPRPPTASRSSRTNSRTRTSGSPASARPERT